MLRTTSLLKGIKDKYLGCKISWLTSERAKGLLLNNHLIDSLYTIERKEGIPEQFNLIINLDDDKETALLVTKLKKDKIIGAYMADNKVTYTRDSSPWFGMGLLLPEQEGGLEKANKRKKENKKTYHEIMAEIIGIEYYDELPFIDLTREEIKFGKDFAKKNDISDSDLVIGLNTGAGGRWKLKKWSLKKTAELADLLIDKLGAKVVLLGGKEEKERNEKIKSIAKYQLIDAGTENTLRQFASIVNICNLLVTSDTLAMFMGIALRKRLVVLIGPTSVAEIEMFGLGEKIYADVPCLCCYKKECDIKPNCMDKISVEMVYSSITRQLK